MPLGVGFEVSRAHAILVGIPLLSLPGARDQDGSPQLLSRHHICLPTTMLPTMMVMDSLSGTISLYKLFLPFDHGVTSQQSRINTDKLNSEKFGQIIDEEGGCSLIPQSGDRQLSSH